MAASEVPDVESLLARAAKDSAVAPVFVEALLESSVIVPGNATGDGAVNLSVLRAPDGGSVQPFYTSEERLEETVAAMPGFERTFIGMPCRAFWEMTRGATLVLNPHSASSKIFLPGEIGQLLDGAATLTPHVVQADTRVLVGQPARVPPGMPEALSALFIAHPDVEAAVLGWKATPQEDSFDEAYLLVIVGSASVRDALGTDLARTLVAYTAASPVDVMFVEPGADHLLRGVPPFYRRRRRLFGRR